MDADGAARRETGENAPTPSPDLVLTLPKLIALTGESRPRLRKAIALGDLRARRPGRRWFLITWRDYVRWRDEQLLPPERADDLKAPPRAWARGRAANA